MDYKLGVVVVPVSDVDRAKNFYRGLGWRLDADFRSGPDFRARADLGACGAPVSEVFHDAGGAFHLAGKANRVPGPDPEHKSSALEESRS